MGNKLKYSSFVAMISNQLGPNNNQNKGQYICLALDTVKRNFAKENKTWPQTYENRFRNYINSLLKEEAKLRTEFFKSKYRVLDVNTITHVLMKRYPKISIGYKARKALLKDYIAYLKARNQ